GLIRRRVIRAVDRHGAVFLHRARLAPLGGVRDRGQRNEAGPFLRVRLVDAAARRAVGADIGDGVEPFADLSAQVVPGRERARAQEVLLEVAERALDLAAPLLVARATHGGLEPVVLREGEERRMPARPAADAPE